MMKKKILMPLLGAVVLGMSAYAGYRTYDAYNGVSESDLLLANAEALAGDEGGGKERIKCYSSTHYKLGSQVVFCSTCEALENSTDDIFCFHDYCYR